jgi:hypothetical protein
MTRDTEGSAPGTAKKYQRGFADAATLFVVILGIVLLVLANMR